MRPGLRLAAPRRERGVILFIALIVLVAMSLAGVALMRSVDTNVLIAGNLAFRQGATAGGDWGVEHARNWLSANTGLLNDDQPAGAGFYWANWQQSLDLIGSQPLVADYNWSGANNLGTDAAGNQVQYVIHRLCDTAGAPNNVQCVRSSLATGSGPGTGGSQAVQDAGGGTLPGSSSIFYRITVRITGPRNTVSFVQTVLN
jgi:type IV pilus assembly protein PilX